MNRFAIFVFSVCLGLAGDLTASAQAINTIYTFAGTNGSEPAAGVTVGLNGNLYGTTYVGGLSYGNIYEITTSGSLVMETNFNIFNGEYPTAPLTLGPDGYFYGTTQGTIGGGGTKGNVFMFTAGGLLTNLVNFASTNGANPSSKLILGPDGEYYGTTLTGGSNGDGTVFKITTNGVLATLANFNGTNGSFPNASLALGPDGNYYGTTEQGGGSNEGTVFMMTPGGTLTNLVNFNGTNGSGPINALTVGPDGNFYGTTPYGGTGGIGIVFRLTTNGTFTTLTNFNGANGISPASDLTLGPDGNLYGTTYYGGYTSLNGGNGYGTVFKLCTNGLLTVLASFANTNGATPYFAGLALGPDNNFYGTTQTGGSNGIGTVFQLDLPPDFITGPANQTTTSGGNVTFSCQPFGTAPFAYQWLSNSIPIVGATNSSFTESNVLLLATTAQFQVVVTNNWGSITSGVARVSLVVPLSFVMTHEINHAFRTSITGPIGSNVVVSASTNFQSWTPLVTNQLSGGLLNFTDTLAPNFPRRFYRANLK